MQSENLIIFPLLHVSGSAEPLRGDCYGRGVGGVVERRLIESALKMIATAPIAMAARLDSI